MVFQIFIESAITVYVLCPRGTMWEVVPEISKYLCTVWLNRLRQSHILCILNSSRTPANTLVISRTLYPFSGKVASSIVDVANCLLGKFFDLEQLTVDKTLTDLHLHNFKERKGKTEVMVIAR
jgi:hypothetical protein